VSQDYLMGLDFGGGGGRCLLLGLDDGRIATAFRAWRFDPAPDDPSAFDIDVDRTWRLLGEASREAIDRAGASPERILGVAVTSMRHGSVVLDAEGREILAAPNRDARGLARILPLAAEHGEALHRRTGHWPNAIQAAGRLAWMAATRPDALARAAAHLSVSDWLAWRLCGEIAAEASQASETLLFDLASRAWAWDWIDRLGLPRRLFPEVRDAGTRLGSVGAAAAADLGLGAGTPVAVGGADTQCGLLGAGVVAPGQVGAILGTTAPLQQVLDRPAVDAEARLWGVHHVVPGRWALESNAGGVGETLEWIAGVLYGNTDHPVLHLLAEAAASEPGAAGVVSSLGAEPMNARQLSLPVGHLTISPLTARDDPARRRHVARAVGEGVAFGVRANLEQLLAASGLEAAALRVGGGLSRSRFFTQLVSDVIHRPLEAVVPESSALGAAICAGVGAGVFRDLTEGAAKVARVERRVEPDPGCSARYEDLYAGWQKLREARRDADAVASGLVLQGLMGSPARAPTAAASAFRPRILVTADLDAAGLAALREIGEVEHRSYREAMRLLTGPSLVEALEGFQVFVTEVDVVDAAALGKATDLRVVGACRGDAVNVDVEACTALGIPVLNTPGRNADAVADLTVAFLLMLARRLPEATAFLREPGGEAGDMGRMGRAFSRLRGHELWRKTVGLVGLGAVGRQVVERLRPFGVRCLVADPFLEPDAVRLAGAEPVTLEALLEASDFVSLHAAVTDASRGLIGAAELARMRPGAFLVNTARAALVDEAALVEALASGHLAGAALDVFAVEPPGADHPLLAMPQVIATPHVGGNTVEVAAHQGRILADDLARLRRGEAPVYLLNPVALDGFDWAAPRAAPAPAVMERLGRRPGPAVTDLEKRAPSRRPSPTPAEPSSPAARPGLEGAEAVEIRDRMETLLRDFLERVGRDARLEAFAQGGQDVTLHFVLSDLALDFHLGFDGGTVQSALGPPGADAGVELKMKADLLDGMFTGRRNAMQAAMDGELSFSGDTAKAMTLTQIQADLSRLYREAREAVGDPGDLASLPDPAAGASASAPAPASTGRDVRQELIEVVNELYAAQLITATGGNVSVRRGEPEEAWITPSQLFKGDLRPEILVRIDLNGRALDAGARSPSSEALMHTAVYKARPEVQAVIHCHAPNATILANAELPFLPISTEAAFLVGIGRIPFVMPGTQELADAVVEALKDGWAVLMQNHGLLVAGRSLRRAADMCEIIERTAQVIIGCYAVGKPPPTLPDETVKALARYGDLMA
jgi:sugar (pentulose or hexulose) kinase/phosphoglycerate dehydrogenase-like enzyme/ribulose-5-phosphate 4-epimerase/fuculose-1-phosphate aldolase/putative sterol carrier protein